MKKYAVKEMFGPTIQGEGNGTGEVVMFLRFAGCNKWSGRPEDKAASACPFCDTDFVGGEKLTADEIVERLSALQGSTPINTLVISGGEPALQLNYEIMSKLAGNWFVYVETNGSRRIDEYTASLIGHVSCSPKQGVEETVLERIDSLKILHPPVSQDRHILNFLNNPKMRNKVTEFYIQPVMDENYRQNLQECLKICYAHPEVRLSVQLHKTIEVQ
jgi:7-carboxy-7-deazaguanine synthase